MPNPLNWARLRANGKVCRNTVTDALKQAGIDSEGYAPFTDAQYAALFGAPAWKIRKILGLPRGCNLRDHLDERALSMIALAEHMTAEVIVVNGCKGRGACIAAGKAIASNIAQGVQAAMAAADRQHSH